MQNVTENIKEHKLQIHKRKVLFNFFCSNVFTSYFLDYYKTIKQGGKNIQIN